MIGAAAVLASSSDTATGVGIPLALTAGLVSFLSPCVLPLVPGYLSTVAGVSPAEIADTKRRKMLIPSLLFIAGSLMRVVPAWRAGRIKLSDVSYLVGLLALFVIQLIVGLGLDRHTRNSGDLQTICVLVIVCCLVGDFAKSIGLEKMSGASIYPAVQNMLLAARALGWVQR